MKKSFKILLIIILCLMLTSCVSQNVDPLLKNETTQIPGAKTTTQVAINSNNNNSFQAKLYFRYYDEFMLTSETRQIDSQANFSKEYLLIQALIDGPLAGGGELKRLIPQSTILESVVSRDDILYVTFNEAFLQDDIPSNWETDPEWIQNATLLRELTVQSIVATITEQFAYSGIQFLIHDSQQVQTSLRMENSYFLNGSVGQSEPIKRNENLLLTPSNTVKSILNAWKEHDLESMYLYFSGEKPSLATFINDFPTNCSIDQFDVSNGSISSDGQDAVVTVSIYFDDNSEKIDIESYPVFITRENGIWKYDYKHFQSMLN